MKLGYCPSDEFLNTDFPCTLDVSVEWELGTPHLVIDNVLDRSGKAPFMHNEDAFYRSVAHRIADIAERDSTLLAEAVARAAYGEAA